MAQAIITKFREWNPDEDEKRRLRRWGFIGYFALATLLFIWIYMPGDAITSAVTTKLSGAIGRPVEAKSVGLAGLSGVHFERLSISTAPGHAIEIDDQVIKFALISTLLGEPKLSAHSQVEQGFADFEFSAGSKAIDASLKAQDFLLTRIFPQERDDRPWIHGTATGSVHYRTPGVEEATAPLIQRRLADLTDTEGQVDLALRAGKVGGIVAGGFPIPAFNYDSARLVLSGAQNKIKIETFELTGPDIDVELSGTIDVVAPFERSRPNLRIHLTTHGTFKAGYDAILATQFKREPDGGLSAFIQGTIGSPRIRE
ncbi:MAG: type II secretion system protein GspN [Chrysiogenetes bacterium]|nr:type II secretion system protein GspN [Chrysiogenetes bacterium]